jgi:hypothetical protein
MIVVRIIVGVLAVVGVAAVLTSVLGTVVVPRAVPARVARIAFLVVYRLLRLRLWLTCRSDFATRDRIFASRRRSGRSLKPRRSRCRRLPPGSATAAARQASRAT